MSNYQVHHLQDLLKVAKVVPAINQVECYPYLSQEPLVKFCHGHDICPQAWGPLGAGQSDVLSNPQITAIANKHGKTPVQVVLRWNVQRVVVVVVPKSVHQNRQKENMAIFDFELSSEEMHRIAELNKDLRLGGRPGQLQFLRLNSRLPLPLII